MTTRGKDSSSSSFFSQNDSGGAGPSPASPQADLEAIKARAEKATPPPWRISMSGYSVKSTDDAMPCVCAIPGGSMSRFFHTGNAEKAEAWLDNAEFMVHAREDIPALIAEIERLRKLLLPADPPADAGGPREPEKS